MSKNKDDMPRTGDGRTRGRKIGRYEVKVQRASGSWDSKQTAGLWKGAKHRAAPPAAAPKSTTKAEPHPIWGVIFRKK